MGGYYCTLIPWFGSCWLFPGTGPRKGSTDAEGLSYMFEGQVYFQDFKKCIVNDGVWNTATNSCSIDVSNFPLIFNDDPTLEVAVKALPPQTVQELLIKYNDGMTMATSAEGAGAYMEGIDSGGHKKDVTWKG